MWDSIASFFNSIIDTLVSIGDGISSFISNIVEVGKMVSDSITTSVSVMGYIFKPAVAGIIITILAIVAIYKVVGREG